MPFCKQCKRYNCLQHTHNAGLTQRLTKLLEHFEEPDNEDMRTYIAPEKTKGNSSLVDPRVTTVKKGFTEPTLRALGDSSTPMPRSRDTQPVTSTAIVRIDDTTSHVVQSKSNTPQPGSSADNPMKLAGGRYRAHERHHFVKLHASSFVSCTSPTCAFSELAFVLWVDNKSYTRYSTSTDRYRVVLSMLYDVEEDLWIVSAKLLKRASYYTTKDDEEGHISNRLCTANELRSEIKKMLLYLGISPRQAYRFFRRNLEEKIVVTDAGAGLVTAETASHSILMKELEKAPTTTAHTYHDYHGYNTNYQNNMRPHPNMLPFHHMRDADARNRSAMFGMGAMYEEGFGE